MLWVTMVKELEYVLMIQKIPDTENLKISVLIFIKTFCYKLGFEQDIELPIEVDGI